MIITICVIRPATMAVSYYVNNCGMSLYTAVTMYSCTRHILFVENDSRRQTHCDTSALWSGDMEKHGRGGAQVKAYNTLDISVI